MYNIPSQTRKILEIIEDAGFEAYIVGGAVRDILIGRIPYDWDITTNALPDEIERIFDSMKGYSTEETGKKNGTITAICDAGNQTVCHEITTYRTDGKYSDGRHPDYVRFSNSLEEDLLRRDFTINAIAMDRHGNIKDPLSCMDDINKKLIKAVGLPAARFSEDALRILRGIRLESELKEIGFKIDPVTEEAMIAQKFRLKNISVERIQNEFNRILLSAGAFEILTKYKEIIEVIIPEIKGKTFFYDEEISRVLAVRLSVLLYKTNNPEEILQRLKYSRRITEDTLFLIKNRKTIFDLNEIDVRKKLNQFGERRLNMLISIKMSEAREENIDEIERIEEFKKLVQKAIYDGDCYKISDLDIDGKDIISLGFEEGPEVGKVLKYVLDGVIEGRISNDRESIIKEVKIILNEPSL